MSATTPSTPAPQKPGALGIARRLRYYLETVGFFLLIGFFRLFNLDRASALGGWIGRNLVAPTPFSRRAHGNLSLAYPNKTASERAAITRAMWDNLGRVMAEYAHLDQIHSTGKTPRIELIGREHLDAAKASGRGVILLSGHFANWEILPFAARDYGFDGGTVVRPANNPYVDRWLERIRSRNGMPETIPKGASGTRRAFSLLRKGEAVLLLADQRASEGILVPFFGREAQTTIAPAALALKLGAVIVPATNERLGGAYFRVRVYPALSPPDTGNAERDLAEFTAAITRFIEARVRERPEQWLWIHKRWIEDAVLRKRALSARRDGATSATSNRI